MLPLVYPLFLSCLIKFNLASLYNYNDGHSSVDNIHIPQTYTYGDNANTDSDVSLIGKASSGLKLDSGSSLLHGNGAGYGSGFGYSVSSDSTYSAKPLHAEDLSLPALDLTKHSIDDVSSFTSLSHGSELLSGLDAKSNNYGTLDSLTTLHQSSSGSLHSAKELSSLTSGDHVNSLLSGTTKDFETLHSNLDGHTTLTEDISSVHLGENSHDTENHSYFSSIIKAVSHGWSALFSR